MSPGSRMLRNLHLFQRAEHVLYVMPDFVREHVGLREIARCLKLLRKLVIEGEIDVNLAVAGAVEGA